MNDRDLTIKLIKEADRISVELSLLFLQEVRKGKIEGIGESGPLSLGESIFMRTFAVELFYQRGIEGLSHAVELGALSEDYYELKEAIKKDVKTIVERQRKKIDSKIEGMSMEELREFAVNEMKEFDKATKGRKK